MAENPRAYHGEVPGIVCGTAEKPHCQRRSLSVQEHLSAGEKLATVDVLKYRALLFLFLKN